MIIDSVDLEIADEYEGFLNVTSFTQEANEWLLQFAKEYEGNDNWGMMALFEKLIILGIKLKETEIGYD